MKWDAPYGSGNGLGRPVHSKITGSLESAFQGRSHDFAINEPADRAHFLDGIWSVPLAMHRTFCGVHQCMQDLQSQPSWTSTEHSVVRTKACRTFSRMQPGRAQNILWRAPRHAAHSVAAWTIAEHSVACTGMQRGRKERYKNRARTYLCKISWIRLANSV